MTLIEANKRLRLELESGNRSLTDALSSAKKTEADLETLKKEKAVAEKIAKDQAAKLQGQVGKLEAHIGQLKDELSQAQAEAEEGKHLGESQLILVFQVMKEALRSIEPDFDLLRLDAVDLDSIFPLAEAAVAGSSQTEGEDGQTADLPQEMHGTVEVSPQDPSGDADVQDPSTEKEAPKE